MNHQMQKLHVERLAVPAISEDRLQVEGDAYGYAGTQSQSLHLEWGGLLSGQRVLAEDPAYADLMMTGITDTVLLAEASAIPARTSCLDWSVQVLGPGKTIEILTGLIQQEADLAVCAAPNLPYPLPDDLEVMAMIEATEQVGYGDNSISRSQPLQGKIAVLSKVRRPELQALFHGVDLRRSWGKVWLIGFGPGDPELMTLKADRVLRQADIIYYDDLIDHGVLGKYPGSKKYVGKRKGRHAEAQEAINEQLYQSALAGKTVARLKGGDPFIFGRGGEETEYLLRRMVAVEVVPGVSAVNAAAASFSIPLTKRGVSASVTLRTAHCGERTGISAREGQTLVYYMAASRLANLSNELLSQGLNPKTPVALVQKASLPDEKCIVSTIEEMGQSELESPLLVIVGHVAGERNRTRTLLYTGSDIAEFHSNERLIHYPLDQLPSSGAGANHQVRRAQIDFHQIDGIVFSSPSTVDNFVELHGPPRPWMLNFVLNAATLKRLVLQRIPRERIVWLDGPRQEIESDDRYFSENPIVYTSSAWSVGPEKRS